MASRRYQVRIELFTQHSVVLMIYRIADYVSKLFSVVVEEMVLVRNDTVSRPSFDAHKPAIHQDVPSNSSVSDRQQISAEPVEADDPAQSLGTRYVR